MKKQILISLILLSSVFTMNAQWSSTGDNSTSGNVIANTFIRNNYGVGLRITYGSNEGNGWEIGRDGTSGDGYLYFSYINAEKMGIDKNGNIGNGLNCFVRNTYGPALRMKYGVNEGNGWEIGRDGISGEGYLYFSYNGSTKFGINKNGNFGIGTSSPGYKLDVCGTIRATEVKVDLAGNCGADFVFKNDYKLMELKELENFVRQNQHLPEIAPEKEMIEEGVNMNELQMKLLQKIEEMTLYIIEQNKKIEQQKKELNDLKEKVDKMESASNQNY